MRQPDKCVFFRLPHFQVFPILRICVQWSVLRISINSYQNSVDGSQFTFTTLQGDYGENIAHAVVVVGYHANGDIIYMDPMYPKLQEASPSYFGEHYNISVSGNK